MPRPRDRHSAAGLLPRMEARPRRDGLTTYRYHPAGGRPINLGTDLDKALRAVLDMNGHAAARGTIAGLWGLYQDSPAWARLAEGTQRDYTGSARELLRVFGRVRPADITPAHIARYLRVERARAPVRANREAALLSNLLNLALERGDIIANPARQVRRNPEQPRTDAPSADTLAAFLGWCRAQPGQVQVLAGMAEFAALTGNRRAEFLQLHWPQVGEHEVRLMRAKQRGRQIVEAVAISPALADLLARLRGLASNPTLGAVFPTRAGNPYTEPGFKAMWSKLMARALAAGAVAQRFTFHDLRAYYVTQHKATRGALPDLHGSTITTARVYDRRKEIKRGAL